MRNDTTRTPFSELVREYWLPVFAAFGLLVAAVFALLNFPITIVNWPLIIVCVVGGSPLLLTTLRALLKGEFNVDVIAILSIVGGLLIGEYLPAAIIVLMLSGGEALEAFALRRASGSLETLLKHQPRQANRWNGKEFVTVSIHELGIGDRILIKPGETVPVDAEILKGSSEFNESLLTGEAIPITHGTGDRILSGISNISSPIEAKATVAPEESTYAKIVALVKSAQERQGSVQRLADRFGAWFTPLTLVIVGSTWLVTRDITTAYAVLVIATPCPLLLATPIAFVAGIGRAAKLGIIVKSGQGLEAIARAKSILFDKTGTLTSGTLTLKNVLLHDRNVTKQSVLSTAASLEQYSNHVVARSIVAHVKHNRITIETAQRVEEIPGKGLRGTLHDKTVRVGNASLLTDAGIKLAEHATEQSGELVLEIAVGTKHVASIVLSDRIRSESPAVITALKTLGFERIAMLTGDRKAVAQRIAHDVGISEVQAQLLPQDKLNVVDATVRAAHANGTTVMMVGDGINDAPALERADIGVAIGKQGGEVAVEAADIVLLGDRLDKLTDAIRIGRAAVTIAVQGIWVGMTLSFVGMLLAAFGYLPPVVGAISQEAIDIIVILNALRVLTI